jgi:hypothetical protein
VLLTNCDTLPCRLQTTRDGVQRSRAVSVGTPRGAGAAGGFDSAAPSPVPDRGRFGEAGTAGILGGIWRWGRVVGRPSRKGGGCHLGWPSPGAGVGSRFETSAGDTMAGKLTPHVLFTSGKGSDSNGKEGVKGVRKTTPKALPKALA